MPEEVSEQGFWAEEFDLSALTFSQFLEFFFDKPVVSDNEQYELFRSGIDYFVASDPAIVVEHLRAMCQSLAELTKVYSHEQLDQGLWAVFGAAISCEQYLFDPAIDLGLRIDCIESMYLPLRDVVAHSAIAKQGSFYFMWWDMILHTFWNIFYAANDRCDALSNDARQIFESMYQTLLKILALDHPACHWSALHGIGHLNHPLGREAVQNYLDVHGSDLSREDVEWIERCRDGAIA